MDQRSPADDYLFIGTHGYVIAVNKSDGQTVWETSLPHTGYKVVVMLVEDGKLLCGTSGKVFALNPETGTILWSNQLPSRGYGVVALATLRSSAQGAAEAAAQQVVDSSSS